MSKLRSLPVVPKILRLIGSLPFLIAWAAACQQPTDEVRPATSSQATTQSTNSAGSAPSSSTTSTARPQAPSTSPAASAPFAPPDVDAVAEPPKPKRRAMGPYSNWVRELKAQGLSPSTDRPPPSLRKVSALKELGKTSLLYVKKGQIHRADLDPKANAKAVVTKQLSQKPGVHLFPQVIDGGKRILFASNREAADKFRLYVANADLSDTRAITGTISPEASWAVDSKAQRLVYVEVRTQEDDDGDDETVSTLLSVNLNTRKSRVLHRTVGHIRNLVFSSDDSRLFFIRNRRAWIDSLNAIDVKTGHKIAMPSLPHAKGDSPVFSGLHSMGKSDLVLGYSQDRSMGLRNDTVYRVPQDGGAWTVLVPPADGGMGRDVITRQSPDAKRLLLIANERMGGFGQPWNYEVSVKHGGAWTGLTTRFARPFYAARRAQWLPDSRHILFSLQICPDSDCVSGSTNLVVSDAEHPDQPPAFIDFGRSAAVISAR